MAIDDYPEGAFLTPYDRDLPYEFQVDEEANPHPPAHDDTDTVTCSHCGHLVSSMDDIAVMDDPSAPDGFVCFHVNC